MKHQRKSIVEVEISHTIIHDVTNQLLRVKSLNLTSWRRDLIQRFESTLYIFRFFVAHLTSRQLVNSVTWLYRLTFTSFLSQSTTWHNKAIFFESIWFEEASASRWLSILLLLLVKYDFSFFNLRNLFASIFRFDYRQCHQHKVILFHFSHFT